MKKVHYLLLVCLVAVMAVSCSPAKYAEKMNVEAIPHDFNPEKHILLLEEISNHSGPRVRNNAETQEMDKAFKKYYKYRYEIIPVGAYETNSKYADTSLYKFVYRNSPDTYTKKTVRTNAGSSNTWTPATFTFDVVNFHFYDRPQGHGYPTTMGMYGKIGPYCQAIIALIDRAQRERK